MATDNPIRRSWPPLVVSSTKKRPPLRKGLFCAPTSETARTRSR